MDTKNLDFYSEESCCFPLRGDKPVKQPGFSLYAPQDWQARAWGFRRAAELLNQHVKADWRGADLLTYPIAFLFRHQLELDLKGIIIKAKELKGEPGKVMATHSLPTLWKECRAALAEIGILTDVPDFEAFEACIRQLDVIDRESAAFRYPVTKSGQPSLPSPLESIDLENLGKIMGRMSFALEVIQEEIAERYRWLDG